MNERLFNMVFGCLDIQSKINKRQKRTNEKLVFSILVWAVYTSIMSIRHEKDIEILKGEIEELKATKGE